MKSNSQLQDEVLEELRWDSRINEGDIGVSVHNGIVTLLGTIPNYAERWAAEDAAQKVKGVVAVVNSTEVKLAGQTERDDESIAAAAVNALQWNVWLPDTIKIIVRNGWITLTGEAATGHQRITAEKEIRDLIGVKGVTNEIVLKPKAQVKDIHSHIKRALHRHAEKETNRISIAVKDGEVELTGSVHSWSEKNDAETAAWATPGVQNVKNKITIFS
jgi:osmotically-inducible protein OsmY